MSIVYLYRSSALIGSTSGSLRRLRYLECPMEVPLALRLHRGHLRPERHHDGPFYLALLYL